MGFLGKLKVALGVIADNGGVFTRRFVADPGGGATVTVPQFGSAGDDSAPVDTDRAIMIPLPRSGQMVIVGYVDTKNAPTVGKGERKLYSRDDGGAVKAFLWLKSDGSLQISNGAGSMIMATNGVVTINGVTIGLDGAINTPGTIDADGAIETASTLKGAGITDTIQNVTVGTHKHPGTNTPPTPGT